MDFKMEMNLYFENLKKGVENVYSVMNLARSKGYDPVNFVEIPLALSMAQKCVSLIATIYPQMQGVGISERILELEKEHGKLDPAICLQIAEEVSKQKFCTFNSILEAITAGTRLGMCYITLGVVSSPLEGLTEIQILKTKDGKDFLSPFFSGPIRSAGGTGAAFSLVILDHLREIFGFARYDPTTEEIKRSVTEIYDYHERITNLQYLPTEEEVIFLASNLPLLINGKKSEKIEVSNYKNLERIETNYIRNGFCLVLGEGIAQKAAKIQRYLVNLRNKGYKLSDWNFLTDYVELHKKRDLGKTDASPTYIKDLVAGRPVFGHPSRSGAFRFRYGRGRVSGFSAASISPLTMQVSDEFLATGTQLKIEKPTKGCIVSVCDKVDGPIIKLLNGSVKKPLTNEEIRKFYPEIEEIIYFGDVLFPFSDLANRNHGLIKPGYVEEWWKLEVEEKDAEAAKKINEYNVNLNDAIDISKKLGVPLHPKYIFYWKEIDVKMFEEFLNWFGNSFLDGKIIFSYLKSEREKLKNAKRALELLGVLHEVTIENIVLSEEMSKSLLINLGMDIEILNSQQYVRDFLKNYEKKENQSVLEIVNRLSSFIIKDKSGEFIGTRMGRPEKGKLRKLKGSPNGLFCVGEEGGKMRNFMSALEEGKIRSEFPLMFCPNCKIQSIYRKCHKCNCETLQNYYFYDTKEIKSENISEFSEREGITYNRREILPVEYFENALDILSWKKSEAPLLVKGIRGMFSDSKVSEHLVKGFLRAKHNLFVNKDGTIRFDATEAPLVSFKPKEVGVSVLKLKELGYEKDIYGNELVDENQILELFVHDILLPCHKVDERADEVFINIANFVDEELEKLYGIEKFYRVKNRDDLVGKLGVCMAPHNCAGVVCRIIGFSNTQVLFASPFMHAAIRRDCDGDEAAIMLLGDVLLNFSRKFLPGHLGGTQDAPLVLNAKIDAGEVDDQILDFEFSFGYPLELYRLAEKGEHSSKVKSILNVKQLLKEGKNPFQGFGFTHDTENFNEGIRCSNYKRFGTMAEKVMHQMKLAEKIRAVDTKDTARLIIERHFLRDLRGNLRKFSQQEFRCVNCNEIVRRPPLSGFCPACKRGKLIFTIHEGGIKKYLDIAIELSLKYNLSDYLKQSLELTKMAIDSIFGKEKEKQVSIDNFF